MDKSRRVGKHQATTGFHHPSEGNNIGTTSGDPINRKLDAGRGPSDTEKVPEEKKKKAGRPQSYDTVNHSALHARGGRTIQTTIVQGPGQNGH